MATASCSTLSAHPRSVRIAGRLSFVISIELAPAGTNPSPVLSFRRLARSRDSQSAELRFVPLFRGSVHKPTAGAGMRRAQCFCRVANGAESSLKVTGRTGRLPSLGYRVDFLVAGEGLEPPTPGL